MAGWLSQLKEYDEKVLVEMYRSILARGGPLPLTVAGDGASARAPAAAAHGCLSERRKTHGFFFATVNTLSLNMLSVHAMQV